MLVVCSYLMGNLGYEEKKIEPLNFLKCPEIQCASVSILILFQACLFIFS